MIQKKNKVVIKNKIKEKNKYIGQLTSELQSLNGSTTQMGVTIDLTTILIQEALHLILNIVLDRKLAFKLAGDKYYFLNDHTINKVMKGLLDENAIVNYSQVVSGGVLLVKVAMLNLLNILAQYQL